MGVAVGGVGRVIGVGHGDSGNGTVADTTADGGDGAGDGGTVVVGGGGVTMARHSGLDAGIQSSTDGNYLRLRSLPASAVGDPL